MSHRDATESPASAGVNSLPADWSHEPVAVLASGGLDSCVLVAELAQRSPRVTPIFVRFGLVWEGEEEAALRRFLAAIARPSLAPLQVFEMPIAAVYGSHWSTGGGPMPDYDSPDSAVFLPGRNLLLTAQAGIWCHLNGVPTLALGPLAVNPFPDGTDEFFADMQSALRRAVQGNLRIVRPYATLTKSEVLRRGRELQLPLELTLSCLQPRDGVQCGACNKCAERQKAFAAVGLPDATRYATPRQGRRP